MRVHGRYSRAEIEAAFGILTGDAPWIHREGVLWHEPSQCDLLFVTLNKSESLFSPTTRYRDLALGPALFHWESHEGRAADGDSVSAGAGDTGGVDAGDGVGGLRGQRQ
ncbi:hypothetical protein IFHNHDMJ_01730 [Synechococcus sp. CBW1107]|nr:hypothetical protein IFHNHDMJ_01730 [Synechococcus sp. CBW1107]